MFARSPSGLRCYLHFSLFGSYRIPLSSVKRGSDPDKLFTDKCVHQSAGCASFNLLSFEIIILFLFLFL